VQATGHLHRMAIGEQKTEGQKEEKRSKVNEQHCSPAGTEPHATLEMGPRFTGFRVCREAKVGRREESVIQQERIEKVPASQRVKMWVVDTKEPHQMPPMVIFRIMAEDRTTMKSAKGL